MRVCGSDGEYREHQPRPPMEALSTHFSLAIGYDHRTAGLPAGMGSNARIC
jgi:hypothetical protein